MTTKTIRLLVPLLFLLGHAGAVPTDRLHALLLDAAVAADNAIVAVGERGIIVRSVDSGVTWQQQDSRTNTTLTAVAFAADGLHGWAVGHDASILATTDGGRSWRQVYQGANLEESFLDLAVVAPDQIIVIGAYGQYLESHDSGLSWQPGAVTDDDSHLNRITIGPGGTLYIAGERGTLLRSEDMGRTWVNIASPYDGSFFGVLPLSATELLAHGLRGRIYHSTDNGDTWEQASNDKPALLATACRLSSGAIVLAGQSRAFLVSHDGGHTFSPWPLPQTHAVAHLLIAPDGRLLAFGEDGVSPLTQP